MGKKTIHLNGEDFPVETGVTTPPVRFKGNGAGVTPYGDLRRLGKNESVFLKGVHRGKGASKKQQQAWNALNASIVKLKKKEKLNFATRTIHEGTRIAGTRVWRT